MPKVRTRIMSSSWLRQREIGQRFPLGHADRFSKELYSSILPCTSWDHGDNLRHARHGGVFNLEFSPDGSLLVAACEKKSVLMFDPLCRKLVHGIDNAHRDCVNCVRFLDSRVFATCSDDSTVALWDARNLKSQIRTLHGHSNWVKNIEFSPHDGLLVTSGFDGSIYTWDINSYTESGFVYNRVFHTNGLMRTRLNPDASKMIICTTGGYLMIIHDLDLRSLAQDLAGFKPNMYRLMQISQTTIPFASEYTHLFSRHRKTNRIELITDFPKGDDAEVVSSLQVHPQGWCTLSRNISNDESSEWTCVHDIQDRDCSDVDPEQEADTDSVADHFNAEEEEPYVLSPDDSDSEPETQPVQGRRISNLGSSLMSAQGSRSRIGRPMVELRMDASSAVRGASLSLNVLPDVSPAAHVAEAERIDDGIPLETRRRGTVGDGGRLAISPTNVELHVSSTDVWEALVAIREARDRRERERERMEREREHLERSLNVRIRMSANTSTDAGNQRRNLEGGGSNSNHDGPRHGRVRILVRRNPDGNVSLGEINNENAGYTQNLRHASNPRVIVNSPNPRVIVNSRLASLHGQGNERLSNVDVSSYRRVLNSISLSYGEAVADSLNSRGNSIPQASSFHSDISDHASYHRANGNSNDVSLRGMQPAASENRSHLESDRRDPHSDSTNNSRESQNSHQPLWTRMQGSSASDRGPVANNSHDAESRSNSSINDREGVVNPTVLIRSRNNSAANTILILDNRSSRTSSSGSAPSGSGVMTPSSLFRVPPIPIVDYGPKVNRKIHQNIPRLTHYIEEPNVGKGFIKELCFSSDGRLICSPFGYGVRLLAFSPDCSELSVCVPKEPPVKLYELATNLCHTDIVVSSKFSPRHCLLVSGCLSGKIVWHQPVV